VEAVVVERVLHHGIPVDAPLGAARVYMRVKRAALYMPLAEEDQAIRDLEREGMVVEQRPGVWAVAPLRKRDRA